MPMLLTLSDDLSVQKQIFLYNCVTIPSYVLLYYDWILTLDEEIRFFWSGRKFTVTAIIFFLNRYLSILGHIPILLGRYMLSSSSNEPQACSKLLRFHRYFAGAIQIVAGMALGCRVWALYGRKLWAPIFLFVLGAAVIGFGTWSISNTEHVNAMEITLVGCLKPFSNANTTRLASSWTGMLVFDSVIFGMTLYRSFTRKREHNTTLLHVLIRDGSLYFGIMITFTVSVIVSFYVSPDYNQGITTSLANVLSSVMISRLMLNLRNPKLIARGSRTRNFTTTLNRSVSADEQGLPWESVSLPLP